VSLGRLVVVAVVVSVGVVVRVGAVVSVAIGVNVGSALGIRVRVAVGVREAATVGVAVGSTATDVAIGVAPQAATINRLKHTREPIVISLNVFIISPSQRGYRSRASGLCGRKEKRVLHALDPQHA
jgi:hypothetical protein